MDKQTNKLSLRTTGEVLPNSPDSSFFNEDLSSKLFLLIKFLISIYDIFVGSLDLDES
jgi:hypothetical protein